MSAPDTNLDVQESNHKPALFGIKAAMVWGGLMLIAIVGIAMMSDADSGATAYEGPAATSGETLAPAAGD